MTSTRRVLLLNPPGREIYIRDYYCSKLSRTDYTFPPVDLLHAGAQFQQQGWDVTAIDAIVDGISIDTALTDITRQDPDAIFCLVGAVSVDEDAAFLRQLRARLGDVCLIGSGDVLREHGAQWVEAGLLDGVALDFCTDAPVRFAAGERDGLHDFIYRTHDGHITTAPKVPAKTVSIGLPPHDLFVNKPYRFPFAHTHPFASVLSDYGCPYRCSFCIMSQLPYHTRPIDEMQAEFDHLLSLGVREFALWDQTFAISKPRAEAFLAALPSGRDTFGWTCFTRPDCIDEELARRMADKGCHTVIMGVESSNAETLGAIQKDFATHDMKAAFQACRTAGLETVATVIVGLPGESEAIIEATMDFVCDLDPDYLSVHTAIPRAGTPLRQQMVSQGLISAELANMDQSGETAVMSSDTLSPEDILRLRKRFNRRFYLRPRFLLRTAARNMRHPSRLLEHARQGLNLILRNR